MSAANLPNLQKNPSEVGFWLRLRQVRFQGQRIDYIAYFFIAPYFLLFLLLKLVPILFGVYVSFTNWSITKAPRWVGLANYQRLLEDEWVVRVWGNTAKLALLILPGTIVVALLFALYANRRWWLSGLVRTFVFAPKTVAITVTALIWVWILEKETGLVNLLLAQLGFAKVGWLTTPIWVLPVLATVTVWWGVGYHMVIVLAGLQEISSELLEAARLDGANDRQLFWKITLPLLRPALILVITLELIASFRIFGQVHLMTGGGPGGKSATIVSYIYSTGFSRFQLGYAATLSLLLFVTILLVSWIRVLFVKELDV
ncbi:MAG: sugar ABC transporter permease [Caldilineaceae bacterium]